MKMKFDKEAPMQIGGQAVIEGVMMRAPGVVATAVRKESGEILIKKENFVSIAQRFPFLKMPLLRGAVGLIEMMVIGIRTLNFSAEAAIDASEPGHKSAPPRKGNSFSLGLTVAVSLVIGVAVFFVTPLFATYALFSVDQEPMSFNLLAGGIRIGLFLGYLTIISMLKDVRRLFEYHGAEHKAVFAFEKGLALIPENAAAQSRFHPRCGTSFLLIVMVVSIGMFSILDTLLLQWLGELNLLTRVATHLPLIPLVGGVSYEFIRISARKSETMLGKIIVAPGLWLQRITTSEPTNDQLEVALAALVCAVGEEDPKGLIIYVDAAA